MSLRGDTSTLGIMNKGGKITITIGEGIITAVRISRVLTVDFAAPNALKLFKAAKLGKNKKYYINSKVGKLIDRKLLRRIARDDTNHGELTEKGKVVFARY